MEQEISFPENAKYLKLTMDTHFLKRSFYYCELEDIYEKNDGTSDILFTSLDNVYYLCDEGLKRGKRFTGALCGMFCYAGKTNNKKVVFFIKKA